MSWRFKVKSLAFCSAPATFERIVECIPNWKICLVYVADIIVKGRTFDEHLKNLGEVLQRISMVGMKLSVMKCAFFQRKVKYLGLLVTADGISTDGDKIRARKN